MEKESHVITFGNKKKRSISAATCPLQKNYPVSHESVCLDVCLVKHAHLCWIRHEFYHKPTNSHINTDIDGCNRIPSHAVPGLSMCIKMSSKDECFAYHY